MHNLSSYTRFSSKSVVFNIYLAFLFLLHFIKYFEEINAV
jgi:hypothetical protein